MPILGLNFDSIHAEKKKELKPPLKINTDVEIVSINKEESFFSNKDEAVLRFNFEFSLIFDPKDVAELKLKGHIHFLAKAKDNDKVLATWKKDKKLPPELARQLVNMILLKANIKALLVGQEVGLPPHIRMPLINKA